MSKESKDIQNMASMLRHGATLTEHACPACSSPLFKREDGELWCAKCQKRVILVKDGGTSTVATRPIFFTSLESTIITKIQEIEKEIKEEKEIEKLQKLGSILSTLLENLEKIRRIKRVTS